MPVPPEASRQDRKTKTQRGRLVARLCPRRSPPPSNPGMSDSPAPADPRPPCTPRPPDPRRLLAVVGLALIVTTVVSIILSMWGRWQATRITKRVAVAYRRKVFDHAVRLSLHRVYEIKSGGVASILREDAGG